MKIFLTGSTSGVGQALFDLLSLDHTVEAPPRTQLDLANLDQVNSIDVNCDLLINCAGTGLGGKQPFVDHPVKDIVDIVNTNLVAPMLLTHNALKNNPCCKIVNVTSTNNNRYWPNDLAYSLTKKSLSDFGHMLRIEYPECRVLEVRLGLTKTNFNQARYQHDPERYQELYHNPCLMPEYVANRIVDVLFDDRIKFIEIAP